MIASDMAWIAAISGQVLLMPQRCFDAASELIHLTRISSCEIENINNFINNDHNEKVKNDFESPRSNLSLYALHSSLHGLHRWGTEGVALTRSMDVVVVFSPRINPGNRRPKPFLTRRFGCQYGYSYSFLFYIHNFHHFIKYYFNFILFSIFFSFIFLFYFIFSIFIYSFSL